MSIVFMAMMYKCVQDVVHIVHNSLAIRTSHPRYLRYFSTSDLDNVLSPNRVWHCYSTTAKTLIGGFNSRRV